MANVGTGGEKGSSVAVQTDENQEDSQALHPQPASMPVSHAVTESEGSGIGGGENIADEKESQVNADVNEPSMEPNGLGLATETQKGEVANAEVVKEDCQVLQNQPKGTPVSHTITELEGSETGEGENVDKSTHIYSEDEKRAMNESTADDASALQAKTDDLGLTTENQKEQVADMEQKCATEISKKDDTVREPVDVGHDASLMASILETARSQEGTTQTQLSSSEKSGDITVEVEKQQNDEHIIGALRSEVEALNAVNFVLRYQAAEVARKFGIAVVSSERLKRTLKNKEVAQDCLSSATFAHALKNQTATKDAEEPGQQSKGLEKKLSPMQRAQIHTQKQTSDMPSEIKAKEAESRNVSCKSSNINKEMDAEIKYLLGKINRQKQEIDSLSKKNNKLLQQYEAENLRNKKTEEMLKNYKEKMIEDGKALSKANRGEYGALKLMEEQQSKMKSEAESMMASLTDELHRLETVFEEQCKLIQGQLSNCTKEIQMMTQKAPPLLREYKSTTDQNDRLISKFLSTDITAVVLQETNRTMKERLEKDAMLLETHLNIERELEELKKEVEKREKQLATGNEEMEETVRQLSDAVNYYETRFTQLYQKYYPKEEHSS